MRIRPCQLLRGVVLVALCAPLCGCPISQRILAGVWAFEFDGGPPTFGIRLLSNGQSEPLQGPNYPPGIDSGLGGVVTWTQTGSEVELVNDGTSTGGGIFVYSGEAATRSSMNGDYLQTQGGNESGTWEAVRLDI